jgi:hypothetical protein
LVQAIHIPFINISTHNCCRKMMKFGPCFGLKNSAPYIFAPFRPIGIIPLPDLFGNYNVPT